MDKKDTNGEIILKHMRRWFLESRAGENLEKNKEEVELAIEEVDERINTELAAGRSASGFESLKNELYAIKFEILERL